MSKLVFNAADVRRVVEHSTANPQREVADWSTANDANGFTPKRSVPKDATVVLVHDQGVYLMSNGTPGDMNEGKKDNTRFVAYAKGCHPDKDANWYDNARSLVGGDDFAEYLPWAVQMLAVINSGAKTVVLNFGKTITLQGLYKAQPK